MLESPQEVAELQALLDRSFEGRGHHAQGIVTAERRLSAAQSVAYLQGVKHVALGTVSSQGEPIVAPLDGWFIHARFLVSTGVESVRAKHLTRRPAVSLCHLQGDDIAFWVHGAAESLPREHPVAVDYERLATEAYGSSPYSWGDEIAVFMVQPRVMFAYASDPSKFPS